jgi:hypothetical protein
VCRPGLARQVLYSATPQTLDTARTRIERDFDPDHVSKLKEAADRDLTVGGAHPRFCKPSKPKPAPS